MKAIKHMKTETVQQHIQSLAPGKIDELSMLTKKMKLKEIAEELIKNYDKYETHIEVSFPVWFGNADTKLDTHGYIINK